MGKTITNTATVVRKPTPKAPEAQTPVTETEANTATTTTETPATPATTPETTATTPTTPTQAVVTIPPEIAGNEALEAIWKQADMIAATAPDLSAKMKAELLKLVKSDVKAKEADAWKTFNEEATKQVVTLLRKLEVDQKVSLKGRKIIVAFPDAGEPQYSHVSINSKGGGGKKSGGTGIKSGGAVVDKATGIEYKSRNEYAKAMGWKYEGRRTAMEAIEDPQDLTGKSLGFKNKVETIDGKFIVTRI